MTGHDPSVLHISYEDVRGGAARSAYRLHEGLRRAGARSRMLVGHKASVDDDVRMIRRTLLDRALNRAQLSLGIQYALLPSSFMLLRHPWVRAADVLQLANIHGGCFAHTALPLLSRRKKVVWCLHDMWALTGHCGFSLDSDRWLIGCGCCPHLDSYPSIPRDATHLNWRLKQAVYRASELTLVAPSKWLGDLARRSPLLAGFSIHVIPYGVDTDIFAPAHRAEARRRFDLADDDRVVLLMGPLQPRKGSDLLPRILARTTATVGPITVLLVGDNRMERLPRDIRLRALGQIEDDSRLAKAYVAADLLLLPTRMDNLPNTMLESLSCGTPVVSCPSGGVPDAVEDGKNGLLRPVDPDSLGDAVAQMLKDKELRDRLGHEARRRTLARFTLAVQAQAYLDLYASIGVGRLR
jgi:glycosyltransferase involved in cell wall biosynthesis